DVTDAWLKFSSDVTRAPLTGLPSVPLMKSKTFRVVAVGTPLSYLTKLGKSAMQRPPSRAGALWLLTYEHPSPRIALERTLVQFGDDGRHCGRSDGDQASAATRGGCCHGLVGQLRSGLPSHRHPSASSIRCPLGKLGFLVTDRGWLAVRRLYHG